MASVTPVSWRPTADMADWLTDRATRSHSATGLGARTRTEMLLWRSALGAELARQTWDLPELGLIAAVCTRPVLADALGVPVGLVAQEVIDATAATPGLLGDAWGVDR